MAINANISKPLENGYVQVDVTYKNGYKRFYKVPQNCAKRYIAEKTQQNKDMNLYSNIAFGTSVFTGFLAAAFLTKKMDKMKQFLIEATSAILLSTLTTLGFINYQADQEKLLDRKYGAKEIFYKA